MDIEKVEQICDLRLKRKERNQRRKKCKLRKYILSEICKIAFLLLIWIVSMTVIVPLSEAVPEKALLFYECVAAGEIVLVFSFWLDKPRRKK